MLIYLLRNVCIPERSLSMRAEITYVKPSTTIAKSINTVNVSYTLLINPLRCPNNPSDSVNKYAKGSKTKSDKFENRNT